MRQALWFFIILKNTFLKTKKMSEAYRRVEKADETLPANEIRVRRGVGIGRYLKRAWELLNGAEGSEDKVVIKGVSNAV